MMLQLWWLCFGRSVPASVCGMKSDSAFSCPGLGFCIPAAISLRHCLSTRTKCSSRVGEKTARGHVSTLGGGRKTGGAEEADSNEGAAESQQQREFRLDAIGEGVEQRRVEPEFPSSESRSAYFAD